MIRRYLVIASALFLCTEAATAVEKLPTKPDVPPGLHLPDGQNKVAVTMHRGGNLLFVDAQINGKDAGFFLLDTGSVLNIIHPATAAKLGIAGGKEGGVAVGVGGPQRGKYIKVSSLRIGDAKNYVTLGRHTMTAMDVSHLKRIFGDRFSGLLGTPLFEKLPYTIDYQRSRLVFHQRKGFSPPKDVALVRLTMADGWPTVPAAFNKKYRGRLLLDTGHEGGVDIADAFVVKHRDMFGAGNTQGFSQGLGGKRADASTRLKQLQLFGQQIPNVPATFRARPHPGGNQPSAELGMIGGYHLRHFQMTMDYKTGRAWARWQPDDPLRDGAVKPAELNRIDYAGMTALTTVIRNRELDVCRSLLKAGADPNLADRRHQTTPLLLAIDQGMPSIVGELLEARADPDKSTHGATPLMIASAKGSTEIAAKLLDAGAKVDRRRPDGATALMLACLEKHADVVKLLIRRRANVNLSTQPGATALMMAAEKGDPNIVRALVAAKANINTGNRAGLTPLILATTNGHGAAALVLLSAKADVATRRFDGFTALHGAAEHNLRDVAKALIAAGADINAKSKTGQTPLQMAQKRGHAQLVQLLTPSNAPRKQAPAKKTDATLLLVPQGQQKVAIPLHRGGNLIFAEVQIDGNDAGVFLLDTGGAISVIDAPLAGRLKLPVVGKATITGTGGNQSANVVKVSDLRIGTGSKQVRMETHRVYTANLSGLRAGFGKRFGGILGTTFFRELPFTVDYRKRQITFYRREQFQPPEGAHQSELKLINGRPTVTAVINKTISGPLMLDTGHENGFDVGPTVVAQYSRLFSGTTTLGSVTSGIGGTATTRTIRLAELNVFGQRLANIAASFTPNPPKGNDAAQSNIKLGLLGARELRHFRLTIDYKSGRIWSELQPDNPLIGPDGKKADINAKDFVGLTPITRAARDRDLKTIKALISAGADLETADAQRFTALRIAVGLGAADVAKALIAAGADVDCKKGHPETPLMFASITGQTGIIEALLAAGANPNRRRPDTATALYLATAYGRSDVVKMLLKRGADPRLPMGGGITVLHIAAEHGNEQIIKSLTSSGANTNAKKAGGVTPLMLAAQKGRLPAIKLLLSAKAAANVADDRGHTSLFFAIESGKPAAVKAIIAGGGDVTAQNKAGVSPIQYAKIRKATDVVKLLRKAE
jgi:ankyrin repeat protein